MFTKEDPMVKFFHPLRIRVCIFYCIIPLFVAVFTAVEYLIDNTDLISISYDTKKKVQIAFCVIVGVATTVTIFYLCVARCFETFLTDMVDVKMTPASIASTEGQHGNLASSAIIRAYDYLSDCFGTKGATGTSNSTNMCSSLHV